MEQRQRVELKTYEAQCTGVRLKFPVRSLYKRSIYRSKATDHAARRSPGLLQRGLLANNRNVRFVDACRTL